MARVLIVYAHPRHRGSRVNRPMAEAAQALDGVDFYDLYRAYPRFDINVSAEQERLKSADVLLLQFPLFWYSTPAIVKEWFDLVLEHGFAYGVGGDSLAGKNAMAAITAAGPREAYAPDGYQRFTLRTFLTPIEQTARLCRMRFAAPYTLFSAQDCGDAQIAAHVAGYRRLLTAIRDDAYDFASAEDMAVVDHRSLPIPETR